MYQRNGYHNFQQWAQTKNVDIGRMPYGVDEISYWTLFNTLVPGRKRSSTKEKSEKQFKEKSSGAKGKPSEAKSRSQDKSRRSKSKRRLKMPKIKSQMWRTVISEKNHCSKLWSPIFDMDLRSLICDMDLQSPMCDMYLRCDMDFRSPTSNMWTQPDLS